MKILNLILKVFMLLLSVVATFEAFYVLMVMSAHSDNGNMDKFWGLIPGLLFAIVISVLFWVGFAKLVKR